MVFIQLLLRYGLSEWIAISAVTFVFWWQINLSHNMRDSTHCVRLEIFISKPADVHFLPPLPCAKLPTCDFSYAICMWFFSCAGYLKSHVCADSSSAPFDIWKELLETITKLTRFRGRLNHNAIRNRFGECPKTCISEENGPRLSDFIFR